MFRRLRPGKKERELHTNKTLGLIVFNTTLLNVDTTSTMLTRLCVGETAYSQLECKLKKKKMLNENNFKKSENCFWIRFRILRIFWNQNSDLINFEGDGVCMSLTWNNPIFLTHNSFACYAFV